MTDVRPVIAITMGDAAGIGPEIIVKALASEKITAVCRSLVIGESDVMSDMIKRLKSKLRIRTVSDASEVEGKQGLIELLDMQNLALTNVVFGKVSPACGRASMEYITRAAELASQRKVGAVVTTPINKEATKQGGYGEVGHLEYLAKYTGAKEYATMLETGSLRVVHLTTHHSLREACNQVTRERVLAKLKLTDDSFRKWGFSSPAIAVAALNPHGGEGGLFGREEEEQIIPAVEEARSQGIDARGPFPADTVFMRAIKGEFDVVLAMYHDQGHIPVKVHGFEKSVSVALGLPFIRTSVDHGTAFDIAGKGIAESQSLEEAIMVAVNLVVRSKLETK